MGSSPELTAPSARRGFSFPRGTLAFAVRPSCFARAPQGARSANCRRSHNRASLRRGRPRRASPCCRRRRHRRCADGLDRIGGRLHRRAFQRTLNPSTPVRLNGDRMSRTIKFAKAGGPEVLEFVEVQVPAPGPNEVRIKVKAIGINRAEAMWRVDDYFEPVERVATRYGLSDDQMC